MSGNITNRVEFKEYVKQHPVIIVKFTSDWCGPCKKVSPYIDKLMAKYYNINYLVVDVDEGRDIASYLKLDLSQHLLAILIMETSMNFYHLPLLMMSPHSLKRQILTP